MMEINTSVCYAKDAEISDDKYISLQSYQRSFKLPANIITEIKSIVKNEYASFRSNKFFSVNVEDIDYSNYDVLLLVNNMKLMLKQIDEFIKRICLNDKEYQMNK